jgi:HK97 family phage prohead protease
VNTPERRYLPTADYPDAIRVEKRDGQPTILTGISPPWDSLSADLGGFREKFAPTAFDGIVDRHPNDPRPKLDVPFLRDHDPSLITGRTTNGRLEIFKDAKGLGYRHDPIQTTAGRDLLMLVEDRTITGASFAFTTSPDGEAWTEDDKGNPIRTIYRASGLYDISAVTYPAYPSSSIAPRSLDAWRAARAVEASGSGLTISLDFDRTFTAAPGLWRSFVVDAVARGHRVVCITRREDTEENRAALAGGFGDVFEALGGVLLCGPETRKRSAAEAAGITVDVWIDDSPEMIGDEPTSRSVRPGSLVGYRATAAAALARLRNATS